VPVTAKRKSTNAKILSSDLIFQGRVFALRREQVVEPSGLTVTREIIVHPGSAVVLPVFPDGRILLIRQYRHAVGETLWELVAGHKEPDETFAECATRELHEESGYTAKRVRKLLTVFPSPGLLGERMEIFLATGLTKGTPRPEDDEKITVRILALREALAWIRTGKIRDAKSVSGVLFYAQFFPQK
jgi:ADP-ribose pyrophosphatase